jgi:uncharacterized protein (DUF1810 family)
MTDAERLARFHDAQDEGAYARAVEELRAGRKTGHWIRNVFPQLGSLGRSAEARHYGLDGADEARDGSLLETWNLAPASRVGSG